MWVRRHLTYANVVSTVCLFVVLGGGAYAAAGLIGRDHVLRACVSQSGSLKLVKAGTKCPKHQIAIAWNQAGPVGRTGPAGPRGPKGDPGAPGVAAGPAGGALTGNYPNPSIADGAVTPAMLALAEGWHNVTAFFPSWDNYGAPHNPASYFKDQLGIVHLRGVVRNQSASVRDAGCTISPFGTEGVLFQLPAGYRPANQEAFADVNSSNPGRVDVTPDGTVCSQSSTAALGFVTLDGITFRAAA